MQTHARAYTHITDGSDPRDPKQTAPAGGSSQHPKKCGVSNGVDISNTSSPHAASSWRLAGNSQATSRCRSCVYRGGGQVPLTPPKQPDRHSLWTIAYFFSACAGSRWNSPNLNLTRCISAVGWLQKARPDQKSPTAAER